MSTRTSWPGVKTKDREYAYELTGQTFRAFYFSSPTSVGRAIRLAEQFLDMFVPPFRPEDIHMAANSFEGHFMVTLFIDTEVFNAAEG